MDSLAYSGYSDYSTITISFPNGITIAAIPYLGVEATACLALATSTSAPYPFGDRREWFDRYLEHKHQFGSPDAPLILSSLNMITELVYGICTSTDELLLGKSHIDLERFKILYNLMGGRGMQKSFLDAALGFSIEHDMPDLTALALDLRNGRNDSAEEVAIWGMSYVIFF